MTTLATRLLIAVALFAAAFVCVGEARHTRRVATAHARLATLQYDAVTRTDTDEDTGWQLAVPLTSLPQEQAVNRAAASYWQALFDTLTSPSDLAALTDGASIEDPGVLFQVANAAFRSTQARLGGDRALTVERLDRVVEAYANVLRASPEHSDASFNYEYVARLRDVVASGKTRRAPARDAAKQEPIPSPDLPTGPTIHGLPGGPPPEIPGSEFRTIAPMPYDEREETDPGEGPAPRRRG